MAERHTTNVEHLIAVLNDITNRLSDSEYRREYDKRMKMLSKWADHDKIFTEKVEDWHNIVCRIQEINSEFEDKMKKSKESPILKYVFSFLIIAVVIALLVVIRTYSPNSDTNLDTNSVITNSVITSCTTFLKDNSFLVFGMAVEPTLRALATRAVKETEEIPPNAANITEYLKKMLNNSVLIENSLRDIKTPIRSIMDQRLDDQVENMANMVETLTFFKNELQDFIKQSKELIEKIKDARAKLLNMT